MEAQFNSGNVTAMMLRNDWQIMPSIRYCNTEYFLEAADYSGDEITFHNLWRPYYTDIYYDFSDPGELLGNEIGAEYLQLELEMASAIRPDIESLEPRDAETSMRRLMWQYQARYPEHVAYTYMASDIEGNVEMHVLVRNPHTFIDITRRAKTITNPDIPAMLDILGVETGEKEDEEEAAHD